MILADHLSHDTGFLTHEVRVIWKEKGVWDWYIHTGIFKIDNQKALTVLYRELCPIFCNNSMGKEFEKE